MRARVLFWPCVIGLAVLVAPAPEAAVQTIAVPQDELARLAAAHIGMAERIKQLEQELAKATGAAVACYAHGGWSGSRG